LRSIVSTDVLNFAAISDAVAPLTAMAIISRSPLAKLLRWAEQEAERSAAEMPSEELLPDRNDAQPHRAYSSIVPGPNDLSAYQRWLSSIRLPVLSKGQAAEMTKVYAVFPSLNVERSGGGVPVPVMRSSDELTPTRCRIALE
jgi:hypothetical protein